MIEILSTFFVSIPLSQPFVKSLDRITSQCYYQNSMTLKEELKELTGKRKRFLLLRIADIDPELARRLCNVTKGTYNNWLRDSTSIFVELYRRRDELNQTYKHEAIHLLRRDNQLAAVLLEERIIRKLTEEIETGEYSLAKTQLAKEVYSRLLTDIDVTPNVQVTTWEQRIGEIIMPDQPRLARGGEIIEGKFTPTNGQKTEYQEGYPIEEGE